MIPWTQADQHIGEEVTVQGRIVATHASPLSTLLSFDQGFDRFTLVIRPADYNAFPTNPEKHYRDKVVRVAGRVVEYRKKMEIVLKSRGQIQIVTGAPAAVRPQGDDDAELTLELLERLEEIATSLQSIGDQLDLILSVADSLDLTLAALYQQTQAESPGEYLPPGGMQSIEPPPRRGFEALRSLKGGMTMPQVERLVGAPVYIAPLNEGVEVWDYGAGRTVTFNSRGRVETMSGF